MEVITEREVTERSSKMVGEETQENLNAMNLAIKKSKFGQNQTTDQSKLQLNYSLENKNIGRTLETTETTFSKLEFDKYNLFFRTTPNVICFDRVIIKNTGTTCIYYKWQKNSKNYNLPEKKSDGIDRFFCHYSDSKLFPDEEREFVFSFFSEKNGVFAEEWLLVTSPPIKNFNSVVHLNGMCLHIEDKYSNTITLLDNHMDKKSNKTMIQEMLLDLISTIKEQEPELPNMKDPNIFKFYFLLNNKEYNVEFSSYIMVESNTVLSQLHDILETPEENRFWNGSIDELKALANSIYDSEKQEEMLFKIETLIHLARRKSHNDSALVPYFRNKLLDLGLEFNEISNSIREEMLIPPYTFDMYTKQSLNEKEAQLYEKDLNKKKDEFYKRTKKKPPKPDEEEKEMTEYKNKLYAAIREKILEKIKSIENDKMQYLIEDIVMNCAQMDEENVDRLQRVKCLKTVKNDGLEGKTAILRVDIEDYEPVYENVLNEEGQVISQKLKEIIFPNAKDQILQTMTFLLDNRVKALVLLVDFGPKLGIVNENFSVRYLKEYLEKENFIEQSISYLPGRVDLHDLQKKIDSEEFFKDNSLIIVENLNFNTEECGFEIENDINLTTAPGSVQNLKYYSKLSFVKLLSLKQSEFSKATIMPLSEEKREISAYPVTSNNVVLTTNQNLLNNTNQLFVLDSVRSILKKFPSVIDMQSDVRCLGLRLQSQLHKLTDFLSINSSNFMLVIGDIDSQSISNNSQEKLQNKIQILKDENVNSSKIGNSSQIGNKSINMSGMENEKNENANLSHTSKNHLPIVDDKTILNTLLTINALLPKFKRIFIMGKVGILFIHFIQNDYVIDPKYKVNPVYHNFMKYILVRANLSGVKIILPEDGIVLRKEEYERYREGFKLEIYPEVLEQDNNYGLNKTENMENIDNIVEPVLIEDYYKYIKKLFKMEKKLAELEALKMDTEELLEHEDYIKNKLTNDEKLLLENYKNNTVEFKTSAYRKNFVEIQEIHKPKKFLKNELEVRNHLQNIYRKPVVIPRGVNDIEPSVHNNSNQEIHSKSNINLDNSQRAEKEQINYVPNPSQVFNYNEFEFVDFGEKTYERLTRNFSKMNCVMWLGKLSPSIVENLNDNYAKIVRSLYERKGKLKAEYNEMIQDEEKKPNESEMKAKKHLFTIFMKSKIAYENIRRSFLHFMLPAEDKDAEVPTDEEQFNYEMNNLIDYSISENFEFINSLLRGDNVPGLFGVSQESKKEKEVELDLKFLDEIY